MDKIINLNCDNYLKYIISPIAPYLICDHHYSTEIYKGYGQYIEVDIKELINKDTNDLYLNKNFDKIKEGDIIQVREKSRRMQIFHDSMRRVNNDNPMPWLRIDKAKMAGYFEMVPEREQILEPINEQLVVELYSK